MSSKKIREIRVTNTESRKKEVLQTLVPGKLTMYSCGPTVYGFIHIGNLRAAMTADLFYKYFQRAGYEVNYVRNYTDIDDKIIKRAAEEGISFEEVTRKYIQEVEKDYAVAGLSEPTHKTCATDHIREMIETTQKLIARKIAYVVDGEVLYSIQAFPEYGKLSHKKPDDLLAGARVEVDTKKHHPHDFTLWKPAKPGEPSWDSPWGKGRPGWHIECSAMASKWLGDQIDVHHGAVDLIFPHHENEIAQSEGATGKQPFVRYWLHNAFLTMDREKMSKSLGNVTLARDFLTRFGGEIARYMLLSVHYRSEADFGDEMIEQTLTSLQRIYEAKQKAVDLTRIKSAVPALRGESQWGSFVADCESTKRKIDDAYANDFSTPEALGALFTLIREFNRICAEPGVASTPSAVLGAQALIQILEDDIGSILGVGRREPTQALADFSRIRADRSTASGAADRPSEEEIGRLIAERLEARKSKDFKRSDAIRDDLAARGVVLKDSPAGTTWGYK